MNDRERELARAALQASRAATSSGSPASASARWPSLASSTSGLFAAAARRRPGTRSRSRPPHFAPKAKSVIYLFMAGAPSQVDLFDPKPKLGSTTASRSPRSS